MQPTSDKIFVSYSRHDEAFARKLAIWLAKTLNLGVWIDIDDIQPFKAIEIVVEQKDKNDVYKR